MSTTGIVMIIDFCADQALSGAMRLMLEGPGGNGTRVVREITTVQASTCAEDDLVRMAGEVEPDIVFFLSDRESLRRVREVAESFHHRNRKLSVVMGIENAAADEVFDVLSHSEMDYVTAPFREADIVPRIRRLVQSRRQRAKSQAAPRPLLPELVGESEVFSRGSRKNPASRACLHQCANPG